MSLVSRTELLFLCRRFLATSAMLLVSASPVSANTDSGEFPLRNLDELIVLIALECSTLGPLREERERVPAALGGLLVPVRGLLEFALGLHDGRHAIHRGVGHHGSTLVAGVAPKDFLVEGRGTIQVECPILIRERERRLIGRTDAS